MQFIFELATQSDSAEILEILEEDGFDGKISLIYTRRPNAWDSYKREGEETAIVICRDTKHNKIAGVGMCAIRQLWVNEHQTSTGYLSGLRVRKSYRQKALPFYKGYSLLIDRFSETPFFLTTILEENVSVQKMLVKKRSYMPVYKPLGNYLVYALGTKRLYFKNTQSDFSLHHYTPLYTENLLTFLQTQGKLFQFFPVYNQQTINYLPDLDNFYLLYYKQQLVAVAAIWDQRAYKQVIVKSYNGIYKWLQPMSKILTLLGYPPLVKPNSILNYFALTSWIVKDNNPYYFNQLINFVQNITQQYDYFTVGIHEQNPLKTIFDKRRVIVYKSKLYAVHKHNNEPNFDNSKIPYIELGNL